MRTIIFSKNRAAQLDLLLRSLSHHAASFSEDVRVIYDASTEEFSAAYELARRQHPRVIFELESAFEIQTKEAIERGEQEHVMFLCDDDIFFAPLSVPHPATILDWNREVLSVSLRLGMNIRECYSLGAAQPLPSFLTQHMDARFWLWRGASLDWGYPGSLDGNIWRTEDILALLSDEQFSCPNEMEERLNLACRKSLLPQLACYQQSLLVGNAVNMVNTTHTTNRAGKNADQTAEKLNETYLEGYRISINSIYPERVKAAHCEQSFVWRHSRDMSRA